MANLDEAAKIIGGDVFFGGQRALGAHDEVIMEFPDRLSNKVLALDIAEVVVLKGGLHTGDADIAVPGGHVVDGGHGVGLPVVYFHFLALLQLADEIHESVGNIAGNGDADG